MRIKFLGMSMIGYVYFSSLSFSMIPQAPEVAQNISLDTDLLREQLDTIQSREQELTSFAALIVARHEALEHRELKYEKHMNALEIVAKGIDERTLKAEEKEKSLEASFRLVAGLNAAKELKDAENSNATWSAKMIAMSKVLAEQKAENIKLRRQIKVLKEALENKH